MHARRHGSQRVQGLSQRADGNASLPCTFKTHTSTRGPGWEFFFEVRGEREKTTEVTEPGEIARS